MYLDDMQGSFVCDVLEKHFGVLRSIAMMRCTDDVNST